MSQMLVAAGMRHIHGGASEIMGLVVAVSGGGSTTKTD
jgi:hypothetical protein